MARPAAPPLWFVTGDDETVIVQIDSDANGTPVDITGRTYIMSIDTPTVSDETGTVEGPDGTVTFVFASATTDAITPGAYRYEVVETASGAESTLMLGLVTVVAGVT